jgi:phosphoglycolate phosphatase-like HAD superfamily hydrolase
MVRSLVSDLHLKLGGDARVTIELASWNDGAAKSAILDFATRVSEAGSPSFAPPAERIATFDNDGTLWLEKPMYIQLQHGLRAIGKAAAQKPELRDRQPFKAVYERDMAWLGKAADDYARGDPRGILSLVTGLTEVLQGETVEAFDADALDFLSNAQDGRFKRPYKQLTYTPMVELVHFLQHNGFQVFITSGGGRDFMRAVCEEIYSIPRSMVIGSSVMFEYGEDAQGVAQVLRSKEVEQPIDDGPGKPVHIHRTVGRRPIMAAGNSDGDIHMLKYAKGNKAPSLALLLRHDDAEREYAYDAGAEKALQLAPAAGWLVVSMKNDWKTVFSP